MSDIAIASLLLVCTCVGVVIGHNIGVARYQSDAAIGARLGIAARILRFRRRFVNNGMVPLFTCELVAGQDTYALEMRCIEDVEEAA